jgi:multiple sugar transport system permease protein
MRGLERTRELFVTLLSEAFHAEAVWPFWQNFVFWLSLAIALGLVARWLVRVKEQINLQSRFASIWLTLAAGFGLLNLTLNAVNRAYAVALETGEDPGIWPQMIIILGGVVLLLLAWLLWKRAEQRAGNLSFVLHLLAALMLMVGAVVLIIQVPTIMAMGDQDLWDGLKITVFFSLGTVPVQLAIALFLSVLLFQRIKGSGFFRVVYFLPYVTPAVASATVFRLLFSEREAAPVNALLGLFGIGAQRWLREAKGILSMAAETLHIEGYPATIIPAWVPTDLGALLANWLTGPSQAMMVVITLSVWTFVGYNVVIYLAGLANIPTEITEAAEIDGANRWQTFRNITFPLLSPTTYFLSLIAVIGTFKAFNTMWVMRLGESLGTIDTISILIFDEFFNRTRYGYASALAFILFAMILALTLINNRVQGSKVFYG